MLIDNENIINRKVIMGRQKMTLKKLSELCSYSIPALSNAINNKCNQSRRLHNAVTAALGVSLAEFWPEYYGFDAVCNVKSNPSHDAKINEVNDSVN